MTLSASPCPLFDNAHLRRTDGRQSFKTVAELNTRQVQLNALARSVRWPALDRYSVLGQRLEKMVHERRETGETRGGGGGGGGSTHQDTLTGDLESANLDYYIPWEAVPTTLSHDDDAQNPSAVHRIIQSPCQVELRIFAMHAIAWYSRLCSLGIRPEQSW